MPNGMRWVGLDVHAHASTVAVFDDVTGEVITRRINGRPLEVLDVLREHASLDDPGLGPMLDAARSRFGDEREAGEGRHRRPPADRRQCRDPSR